MKKTKAVLLMGILAMFAVAGCAKEDERQTTEGTNTPAVTPTEAVSVTSPGQPYAVRFSGREEVDEAKDGAFVYFTSKLYYPVFEGDYADNLNRFVDSLTEEFREALPDAKENAAMDYGDSKVENFSALVFPELEEFTVSCLWSKEQIHVLFTNWLSESGGAHPNTYCKAYVVDMTSGDTEDIESVLAPYGVTKEQLVTYVTEQIQKEFGDELYPFAEENGLEEEIRRFTEENQWFLNEKGLSVFANPYDIAPYAYGMIECEIAYKDLEDGLKK